MQEITNYDIDVPNVSIPGIRFVNISYNTPDEPTYFKKNDNMTKLEGEFGKSNKNTLTELDDYTNSDIYKDDIF